MDRIIMSMTEFMAKHGQFLGWPPDKVAEMGRQAMKEKKDFFFIVRDTFYTIPLMSLEEYFNPPPKVEAPEPVLPKSRKF